MPVPLTLFSILVTTEHVLPAVLRVASMNVVAMMRSVFLTTGCVMAPWTVEMVLMSQHHVPHVSVGRVSSSVVTITVPW